MPDTRIGWTQQQIDDALPVIKAKRDAAYEAGKFDEAERHEGWMNRLLDARPHHRSR